MLDAAVFPRDKVCAGWITPQVVTSLDLDVDEYRKGRTFQPISGFRVGLIGGGDDTETNDGRQVSFGIRRCEFDHYLLERSGARVNAGTPVTSLRRDGDHWIVNESIRTPLVIGAGGHFCPVARAVNGPMTAPGVSVVAAQEAEFLVDSADCRVSGEAPELYFCRDFKGYGWCFRREIPEHWPGPSGSQIPAQGDGRLSRLSDRLRPVARVRSLPDGAGTRMPSTTRRTAAWSIPAWS